MKLLDFIDKYTKWLDLSWMVTKLKQNENNPTEPTEPTEPNEPTKNINYKTPLLNNKHSG
jgi:hypothetical protein